MPRRLRVASGGYAYHVLNRAVGRMRIFGKQRDFEAFEEVIGQAKARLPMRVLGWCVMPNHWHFVLWPRGDADLSEFMRWLTVTHTQRWHAAHRTAGTGPLYQGRFKSFPIQEDDHLLAVLRYVERNPLRANLVEKADAWRWSSLWHRVHGGAVGLLDDGPLALPKWWRQHVQAPQTEAELEALRRSVVRGRTVWREYVAETSGEAIVPAIDAASSRPAVAKTEIKTPDPFIIMRYLWFTVFPLSAALAGGVWLVVPKSAKPDPATDYLTYYKPVAENLVDGRGLVASSGEPAMRYPPGHPVFVAATMLLADGLGVSRESVLMAVSAILHGLVATLLSWFAFRCWDTRWALLPALLWTCYPLALWMIPLFMSQTPYTPVLLAAVMAFWISAYGARVRYLGLLASGIAVGLAMLLRPIALPIPLVLIALLLTRRRENPWRNRLTGAGLFLTAVIAVVMPWEIWMYRHCDKIECLSSGGLPSAIDGLTYARQIDVRLPYSVPADLASLMTDLENERQAGNVGTAGQLAHWLMKQTVDHPLTVTKLLAYKAARSWYATNSHRNETPLLWLQMACLGFAAVGGVRLWRAGGLDRELLILVLAVVCATWLMTIMVLSVVVYMVPVMGLLFLLVVPVFRSPLRKKGETATRRGTPQARSTEPV